MEDAGWLQLKGDAAPEKQMGLSDRFFFGYGGITVIVEFKKEDRPSRKGAKLQDYIREQFRERGFRCYKPSTEKEAWELCDELCMENRR
jgi:hypothetical protein